MWKRDVLLQLMNRNRITQRELARRLGTASNATVARWIDPAKDDEPRFSQVVWMAKYFGVDLVVFAGEEPADRAPAGPVLTDDEQYILRVYRDLVRLQGMTAAEAMRRLNTEPPAGVAELLRRCREGPGSPAEEAPPGKPTYTVRDRSQ